MQKIKPLYRATYEGEHIVTELNYSSSDWVKSSEYISNKVDNQQISNKAVILGNGPSSADTKYQIQWHCNRSDHQSQLNGRPSIRFFEGFNKGAKPFAQSFGEHRCQWQDQKR